MKESVARKWIEALRSGRFIKTENVLKEQYPDDPNYPEYCVLGVLKEPVLGHQIDIKRGNSYLSSKELAECGMKRASMKKFAELNDSGFDAQYYGYKAGLTFHQLADYIEQNWESL